MQELLNELQRVIKFSSNFYHSLDGTVLDQVRVIENYFII